MARDKDLRDRMSTARRIFSLIPLITFLATLALLSSAGVGSAAEFGQVLLRSLVVSLVTTLVCVGAYGFYRYLQERSPGL
mgnify:CR=1 FL=1